MASIPTNDVTLFRVSHASRVLAWASRPSPKASVRRDAGRGTRDACDTRNDSPNSGRVEHKLELSGWAIMNLQTAFVLCSAGCQPAGLVV